MSRGYHHHVMHGHVPYQEYAPTNQGGLMSQYPIPDAAIVDMATHPGFGYNQAYVDPAVVYPVYQPEQLSQPPPPHSAVMYQPVGQHAPFPGRGSGGRGARSRRGHQEYYLPQEYHVPQDNFGAQYQGYPDEVIFPNDAMAGNSIPDLDMNGESYQHPSMQFQQPFQGAAGSFVQGPTTSNHGYQEPAYQKPMTNYHENKRGSNSRSRGQRGRDQVEQRRARYKEYQDEHYSQTTENTGQGAKKPPDKKDDKKYGSRKIPEKRSFKQNKEFPNSDGNNTRSEAVSKLPASEGQGRSRGSREGQGPSSSGRGGSKMKKRVLKPFADMDDETQRGSLVEQLSSNTYECMICCDVIRRESAIWSCGNCNHMYHLRCAKKWARSSSAAMEGGTTGWRCPACQNITAMVPTEYRCFCGKMRDPETNHYEIPHSCGELCAKKRPFDCTHPCNILCHPGPCPPCQASITKQCNCARTKQTVKCGQATSLKCTEKCLKTLNCGKHACQQVCHAGPCDPCRDQVDQACFCGKVPRQVICGSADSFVLSFCCEQPCQRLLSCDNHRCDKICHPGPCSTCPRLPTEVTRCPCGKTELTDITPPVGERKSCLDAIPTCDALCDKELLCGPTGARHRCIQMCHEEPCVPCDDVMEVKCRCGAITKEMTCQEALQFSVSKPFTCDKRCNKKRQCGRHKCGQLCCVDVEHKCDIICGRKLTCGLHRCEEPCHRGNCPTCWQVSFEELRCRCGFSVIFPPVACGKVPPECTRTCGRTHPCDHPVRHRCQSGECPPCTELTEKWCLGKHEIRKNIPCYLSDISCGMPCNKRLACGHHQCQRVCHKGACLVEDTTCQQPCPVPRDDCTHPCGAPCHGSAPCPKSACRAEVRLKCECGNRSEKALCMAGSDVMYAEYQKMTTSLLAMKMTDAQDGQSIDISSLMKDSAKRKTRKLECTSECAILERNKRLALALEIKNPDLSSKLGTPNYSQFLKDFARKNPAVVASIDKAFTDLVQAAQKSKKPFRSHAFAAMNREQRRVVHELADCYGCETQSYDEEPKKNVVATAHKGKCWTPSVTLAALTQRELHPKAPMPMPLRGREDDRTATQAPKPGATGLSAWGPRRAPGSAAGATAPSQPPAKTLWTSKLPASQSRAGAGPSKWTTQARSAGTSSDATGRSSPDNSAETSSVKPKAEPEIDYFEMTS